MTSAEEPVNYNIYQTLVVDYNNDNSYFWCTKLVEFSNTTITVMYMATCPAPVSDGVMLHPRNNLKD